MLNTTPQKISLDFNQNTYKAIYAKQYDDRSRKVIITCMENGQKFDIAQNLTAQIKILTPDNRAILESLTIQNDHTLLFVLNQNILAAAGKAVAEVRLYDNSSLISTMLFYIIIEGAVYSDDILTASEEFNALTDVMNKASEDYTYVMDNAQASAEAAKEAESNAAGNADTAALKASEASDYADLSVSYAVGGTDSREGEDTDNSKFYKEESAKSASDAAASASIASAKASESADSADRSKSYAIGTENAFRENDAIDNAKYYYQQTREISEYLQGTLLPMGTIAFSQLNGQSKKPGYMYNISDEFTTDDTFKEGAGYTFPAGTNVYYTADGYWDCLTGTMVSGIKGNAETSYRKGNVNITPADIGLGSVNNTADSEKSVKYATSAGNANTAAAVVDYGDSSQTIKIGYGGPGGNTDNLNYIAGYISGGSQPQIKDVPKNVLQAWLGLGSAAYTSSNNYASNSHTHDDRYYTESEVNNLLNSKADSNHSHSYLPLSGGTLTGAVNFANNTWNKVGDDVMIGDCNIGGMLGIKSSGSGDTGIYMWGKSSGSAPAFKMGSDSRTLFLYGTSYLNLCSPGIQCRSYDDNSWSGISAASYTTQSNSSRKLKDNIKDITDERARQILDVNIVTFDYKEGIVAEDHRYDRTGVIAEDTENVCPEVINYDNNEPSGVQYDRFIPYLIKMVQLQENRINELEAALHQAF